MEDPAYCAICKKTLDGQSLTVITLREKGSAGINRASEERHDDIHTTSGQLVHQECRRNYCNPQQISRDLQREQDNITDTPMCVLRSSEETFNFSTDCLFCSNPAIIDNKRKTSDVFTVTTIEFKQTVLRICDERQDAWAEAVRAKLLSVHDLPAADSVYHQKCSVNFRTKKQLPKSHVSTKNVNKKTRHGRPCDEDKAKAFLEVARFLEENDDEQVTINDLIEIMQTNLNDQENEPYGFTHMKAKLQEHFGSKLIITEINGKANVVTFRHTAAAILQEFHARQRTDPDMEKVNIIQAAAKLIKADIQAVETLNKTYPAYHELSSVEECTHFLPESLKLLLEKITQKKDAEIKIASLGQAIMQVSRPRVLLAPLQVGLGVQLYHHFSSRFLIDSLHQHGFCCSYADVLKFVSNAALVQGTDIPGHNNEFVQYIADNVDHNIRTLDGLGTFHGMGIIATITPATKTSYPVPRQQVSSQDLATVGQIKIQFHKQERDGLSTMQYQKLFVMKAEDPTGFLDILWKTSLLLRPVRPSWSGMMQLVHRGKHPGRSSVMFLPMIDMSSSDTTCIYSTLKFVCEHAKRHNVMPVITFDQPLWWKALSIIISEPVGSELRGIVLRLGGFHTEMSYLGAIGHLMAGSGLQDIMELMYAPNAVQHIMSGKAIARAVRAHLLVDAVLNTLIACDTFEMSVPLQSEEAHTALDPTSDTTELTNQHTDAEAASSSATHDETTASALINPGMREHLELGEAAALYDKLLSGESLENETNAADTLSKIKDHLQRKKESIKESRTAALWLLYMDAVDILRTFIRAERTGNWALHLQSVSDMLPYLASSGHNMYTKSATLYLQNMAKLQDEHPDIYRSFEAGYHVVRRSDRTWAGLSTDLVIEQALMRSMKTSGGLTRGRGMTEKQRTTWLLSMPACAQVNQSMQELTGVNYNTGEQNKDLTKARQIRDMKDTSTILQTLQERNPFTAEQKLRNIMTGVTAHPTVNVDNAVVMGQSILDSMDGQTVSQYSFKKKKQAITLAATSAVKIDGEAVQVDSQLLFQRLVIAARTSSDMERIFQYELCSHPTALFDSSTMLRQPQKSILADAIWSQTSLDIPGPGRDVQYVLDGGALLHRIPWPHGTHTYREIVSLYTDYVTKKYGQATVVFDGYTGTSTKHMTHKRRAGSKASPSVLFEEEMKVTTKKDLFLANTTNKQMFINMLSKYLRLSNCQTHHSQGDADLLIVQTAVESAKDIDTVLVGDDTDLLVLLCYHTNLATHELFFKPEPKKNTKKSRVWNMKIVKEQLGPDICGNILFIHAILGCDTTSHIYGIGKGHSLKKFLSSPHFQEQAKVFCSTTSSTDQVVAAGERALVCLYSGKCTDGLDSLRYKRFCEKVSTKTSQVQPQSIPPTSAATRYHSLRVYLQVQQWIGGQELSPEEWGWKSCNGQLFPVLTDLPPAPDQLLRIIRCNCTSDCSSLRCTCRKLHLDCSDACGHCRGSGCTNSAPASFDEEDGADH